MLLPVTFDNILDAVHFSLRRTDLQTPTFARLEKGRYNITAAQLQTETLEVSREKSLYMRSLHRGQQALRDNLDWVQQMLSTPIHSYRGKRECAGYEWDKEFRVLLGG